MVDFAAWAGRSNDSAEWSLSVAGDITGYTEEGSAATDAVVEEIYRKLSAVGCEWSLLCRRATPNRRNTVAVRKDAAAVAAWCDEQRRAL